MKEHAQKAIEHIGELLDEVPQLKNKPRGSQEFQKWYSDVVVALGYGFGPNSRRVEEFKEVRYSPGVVFSGMGDEVYQQSYVSGLESATAILESARDELRRYHL